MPILRHTSATATPVSDCLRAKTMARATPLRFGELGFLHSNCLVV
jgi:hypothetical protein